MSKIYVSKCYYYNADNSPFCCELYDNECEAQNCYFQQLQQLKDHCKQVDETNKILYREKCELIKENEELKKKLQNSSDVLILETGQKEQYQDEYIIEKIDKKKYKQCLDEIEEIINNFADKDIITLPDLSKEKNYKLIAEQYAKPIKQILQKIKEVKGNE